MIIEKQSPLQISPFWLIMIGLGHKIKKRVNILYKGMPERGKEAFCCTGQNYAAIGIL
jgi:hypothetical protein